MDGQPVLEAMEKRILAPAGKENTCFSNDRNGYSPFATYGLEILF